MRVAIVGSRDYPNRTQVEEYVATLEVGTVVVSGGATGVDTWAVEAAQKRGLKTVVVRPDWATHGKAAGMIRNRAIVEQADAVVAFWDGQSPGTKHTLDHAARLGKPVTLITSEPSLFSEEGP